MKIKPLVAAAFLAAAVVVDAQDGSTVAADTAALIAERTYLEAKLAKLQAEEKLQAQIDSTATAQKAADKAAKDARDQAQRDTLKAIGELAGKMPAGTYTSTADGVATPKAMELAFRNLDLATVALHQRISAQATGISGKTVIFVDAIPGPKVSFELLFYNNLIGQIEKDAEALGVLATQTQSVGAAAVISALPSIVSAVGGFFRVDDTERVFDAKFTDSMAVTSLIGKLKPEPPAPVYLGLEAFAFANVPAIEKTPLAVKIIALGDLDASLAAKAKGIDTKIQEKAVAAATNVVAATKARVAMLESRSQLLTELAAASPRDAPAYYARIKEIGEEVLALGTKLAEQNIGLADAKAALAPKEAEKSKIGGVRDRIAKLFTDLRSTEGNPPLFVRLIRDEQLKGLTTAADTIRFVQLRVAASPQGTITKKSFWGQSSKASSLVALEYRIADGNSRITAAGIIPYYSFEDAKLTQPQAMAK